jgi:hypothetical protein
MVAADKSGWIIGKYTGDPHVDQMVSAGTTACANNLATVVVDGPIIAAIAVGTTAGAEVGVRCSSTGAQLTAGSAIFYGSASATDTVHYFIVHGPKR